MNVPTLFRRLFSSPPLREIGAFEHALPLGLLRAVRAGRLIVACVWVLVALAAGGSALSDRQRTLATAERELGGLADHQARRTARVVAEAMARLSDLAAQWDPSASRDAAETLLRSHLRSIPNARFLAVQDAQGHLLRAIDASDTPSSSPLPLPPPASAGTAEGAWEFFGSRSLLISLRIGDPAGGRILLGLGHAWKIGRQIDPLGPDRPVTTFLLGAGGIIATDPLGGTQAAGMTPPHLAQLLPPSSSSPSPSVFSERWQIERRAVVARHLDLLVALDRDAALASWRERTRTMAEWMALPMLLLAGLGLGLRAILARLFPLPRRADASRLAMVSQRLSPLSLPEEIVARAEILGRGLFGRDDLTITLGPSSPPGGTPEGRAPAGPSVQLREISGRRLGEIRFADRTLLQATDQMALLEPFARVVVSALTTAGLHQETEDERRRLREVLEALPWGLMRLDRAGRILSANAAAVGALGGGEVMGKDLRELLPELDEVWPDFPQGRNEEGDEGLQAGCVVSSPARERSHDLRVLGLEEGFLACLRERDTERGLEDKLRQAQRMETIGQLAGGIAHDVNNLMTVILGNLELLALRADERRKGEPDPDPDLDSTLAEAALRAGGSASQLMHRLVGFSRQQKPQAQALRLEPLLRGLEPLLRRALSEQISLRIHWPDDLWMVLAPSADLESALLNLALNAQDAMPGGGNLTVQAANVVVDRVYAAVAGLQRTGDFIMFCVADTGTGMAKDVLDRAIDLFFTTKAPGKGTGLGLAMVYAFAQQNGGHVLIDSEPGSGTVVRLYLPRAAQPPSLPRTAPPPGTQAVTGTGHETLLLVEDNEQVRTHAADMLARLGYQVRSAPDGPAALEILAEGFRPELLITDVILPGGITGRDVAEQAQRRLPGLRILFTSGYPGGVLIENGRLPPGVDLLAKPFRRSELAARVRAHLDSTSPRPARENGARDGGEE